MAGARKQSTGGTLKGAYASALEGVELPENDKKASKVYMVKAPPIAKPGTAFTRKIKGEEVVIIVPDGFDRLKASRIRYTKLGDVGKIIASTLPTVPGYEIALSKPIVYGCETLIIEDKGLSGKATLASTIAKLTQESQDQVNSLAIQNDCNAVLGCHFSIATDSGQKAGTCRVVVSCFGTPCVVVPSANIPLMAAPDTAGETLYDEGINTDDCSVYSVTSEATEQLHVAPKSLLGPADEEAVEEESADEEEAPIKQ